jgi:aspartyl/asparaginyl beta-hydroxylase (cupin superfamily)
MVNGRRCHWDPDVLFDDTFPHAVSNPSSESRVVLLLDILRDFKQDDMNRMVRQLYAKASRSDHVQRDVNNANEHSFEKKE